MPQITVNSTNIATFSFKATFDIYNRQIIFDASATTYNGGGISLVRGIAFSLIDQAGVTILSNTFPTTQIPTPSSSQVFTYDASSLSFAFLFQNYQIIGSIQDQDGTVYSTTPVYKNICQPVGITESGYVPGVFQITPNCNTNVLTVKELTVLIYSGLTPLSTTKDGVLNYPTGTISPVDFANTPFTNNVIWTGNYNITCTTVATYDLQDYIYVSVSYITNQQFNIVCGNFLGDVACCLTDVYNIYLKNCENAIGKNALQRYNAVTPLVLNGLIKQSNGQDASEEAFLIKKQLNCNCNSNSLGQNEITPVNPAVNSIVVTGAGGTTVPAGVVTGNTVTYTVTSNVYQVVKGDVGDVAFTIALNTSTPNTVQYVITFNYDVMAGYILDAIGGDPVLLAQLNTLVNNAAFNLTGLNGACIIDLTKITYALSQNVTGATLVSSVTINGVIYLAPTNLFANTPSLVQGWLNSLSLGVFTAVFAGSTLTVLSINNTNALSTMTFSSPNVVVQFSATSATLVQVLQAIINYLCNLTDLQVKLNNALTLCMFDYAGNPQSVTLPIGTTQNAFNANIVGAVCNLAGRINTLTGVSCTTIKNLFVSDPLAVFASASDWVLSSVGGVCTQLTAKQLALAVIGVISSDMDVKSAFCNINCASPATCPDITANNIGLLSPTSIGIYGVVFAANPLVGQVATVKYRVTGSGLSFQTATNNLGLLPNGNVSGSSPFVVSGLTAATQYDILIQNNCGGTGFISQITTPSGTLFSAQFLLDVSIYTICGQAPVTLYSSVPFATGVTMYGDAGLSIPATGYHYIAPITSGVIYQINNLTAVVGAVTGSVCSTGIAGSYILGNSTSTICAGSPVTLYTNGGFAVGGTLYSDSALTTPVTGSSYVVFGANGVIYNLSSVSGQVGASTGLSCANTQAISIRVISGASYWTNRAAACAAKAGGGCGFGVQTLYVRNADLANYLSGIPVTAYADALGTVIYTDFSIPPFSTKERMLLISDCIPNIWQTDVNNFVSITQESPC